MLRRMGFPSSFRPRQRLRAPRVPLHGVVRMLLQVGAGLVDQSVWHGLILSPPPLLVKGAAHLSLSKGNRPCEGRGASTRPVSKQRPAPNGECKGGWPPPLSGGEACARAALPPAGDGTRTSPLYPHPSTLAGTQRRVALGTGESRGASPPSGAASRSGGCAPSYQKTSEGGRVGPTNPRFPTSPSKSARPPQPPDSTIGCARIHRLSIV